jgi:hypothetical protein
MSMLGLILIIILVLILLGGVGGWPRGPWYGAPPQYGPYYGGGLGVILIIIVLLLLLGRL